MKVSFFINKIRECNFSANMFSSGMMIFDGEQHRCMRRDAFKAVVISTAAVMTSIVTLPVVYNNLQSLQSHIAVELDHCRVIMFLPLLGIHYFLKFS